MTAIVGGAKVSTKLALLSNLIGRVEVLVLGGSMANTFLAAQGVAVGRSMQEPDLHETARNILTRAGQIGCEVILPQDVVVARRLASNAAVQTVPVNAVPIDAMILDLGPATVQDVIRRIPDWRTMIWNGPPAHLCFDRRRVRSWNGSRAKPCPASPSLVVDRWRSGYSRATKIPIEARGKRRPRASRGMTSAKGRTVSPVG